MRKAVLGTATGADPDEMKGVERPGVAVGRALVLEASSGLAGNLLVTALERAGASKGVFDSLPAILDLDGFTVGWDDFVVCDGHGGVYDGTVEDLISHVHDRVSDEIATAAGRALQLALTPGRVTDHTACDTAFDTVAFFTGLAELGWPPLILAGPLPSTDTDHATARALLSAITWETVSCELELVTPTAAALLTVAMVSQLEAVPEGAALAGEVFGRFARRAGLPPIRVWWA